MRNHKKSGSKIASVFFLFFAIALSANAAYSQEQGANSSIYSLASLKSNFASWGISPENKNSSINLEESWKFFQKKTEVLVAVIDTGIQFDHPFLANNIYVKKNAKADKNKFGIDFSTPKRSFQPNDTHGHGTHVSGIIKSIFPEVQLLALKYYNPSASGQKNLESTIEALRYAVEQNVDIINYSGGGPEPSDEELKILKQAQSKGILVIAAAGNEKSNIDIKQNAYYPASYGLSNIITVGAHNEENEIIASSNWGSKSVDIAAPGFRIKSAIPGNGAGYMTGTSQATAFVSGVAALLKSKYPEFNYQQIRNIIVSSSVHTSKLNGKVLGAGKLDAARAMKVADNVYAKLFGGKKGRNLAKK